MAQLVHGHVIVPTKNSWSVFEIQLHHFLSMMATANILSQIEAQALAADVEQTCDELEKENLKESHLSINYISYNSAWRAPQPSHSSTS